MYPIISQSICLKKEEQVHIQYARIVIVSLRFCNICMKSTRQRVIKLKL